ncbi:hypothetical protein [Rhodopirellula europaea]|uniref:hypothetical protein n=1 Tax=Rhodopirellula europaea TaxID=1263866 RepID=UPI001181C256|nr:hypothetical protein [Rhodopirellula europaea]
MSFFDFDEERWVGDEAPDRGEAEADLGDPASLEGVLVTLDAGFLTFDEHRLALVGFVLPTIESFPHFLHSCDGGVLSAAGEVVMTGANRHGYSLKKLNQMNSGMRPWGNKLLVKA